MATCWSAPHNVARSTFDKMQRSRARNQEVTDAQGRRRFHGAFTGGFSAGYYNSVGSEEGWMPKTFSSSRGNRSARTEQRPEDFMDEDDDPLLGKRLETTERYDTLQTGAKRRLQQQQPAPAQSATIPEFSLPEDWVLPVDDSIGATLLKQMGWKKGHGIGQRVRRRKYQKEEKKVDPSKQGENYDTTVQDEAEEEVYVPSRKVFDVNKAFPKPKLDRYGAGFDPYRDAPEFSMHKQQQEQKLKEKEGSHRQVVSFMDALKTNNGSNRATTGYGLSSLEENDDIDVYGTVSMAEFDRVIAPLGARKNVKRLDSSAQESRRHEKRSSRALCSDGRLVLPGFELAKSKEKPPKAVNLRLVVPPGFKAYHHFNDGEGHDDAVTALYRKYKFSTDTASSGLVTAKQRSVLLGDSEQNGQGNTEKNSNESVFDLLGEDQRAKLLNAAAQAKQSLHGAHITTKEEPIVPKPRQALVSGSDGDHFRETISASIAKRFVSANSTLDEDDTPAAKTPQAKLSRRSQSLWIPKSLLCKRFHVKCAGPTGAKGKDEENDKKQDLFDKELVPHLIEFAADRAAHQKSENEARETSKFTTIEESKHSEEAALAPLPSVEKASADLLKSIFEPSDESEVSEDDSEEESEDDREQSPQETSPREDADNQRQGSSAESSVSDDDDSVSASVAESRSWDHRGTRGEKRPHSVDAIATHDDGQQAKEERRKHKKHHKHHKHSSSRDERGKKRKKEKKERKERKSHSHHSSRHSRRSRSRSAERSSHRHRSSSRRH